MPPTRVANAANDVRNAPIAAPTRLATDAGILRALLGSVLPACSKDTARMHLCAVRVELRRDSVTAVATNGHWLAVARTRPADHAAGRVAIEGPEAVWTMAGAEVARILKTYAPLRAKDGWGVVMAESVDGASITVSGFGRDGALTVRNGDAREFPPWRQVIPQERRDMPMSLALSAEYGAAVFDAASLAYGRHIGAHCVRMAGTGAELEPVVCSVDPDAAVEWTAIIMPVRT